MEYNFFATISRMKYIDRWALMRNTRQENLSEHSADVAAIAHAIALLKNVRFGGAVNAERAAFLSMSRPAIMTGWRELTKHGGLCRMKPTSKEATGAIRRKVRC